MISGNYFERTDEIMLTRMEASDEHYEVESGSGALIPTGWTNIVVTNMSATVEGSFTVFVK